MTRFPPLAVLGVVVSVFLLSSVWAGDAPGFPGGHPRSLFERTADFQKPSVPRIQEHFELLDEILRAEPVAELSTSQRARRQQCIEHLSEYRERGRFPRQRPGRDPSPVFIDAAGTACAVGYLMVRTGARELAETIAREDNRAYVPELASRPEVVEWAQRSGLSLEECAMIQPTYCHGGAPTDVEIISVGNDVHISWTNQDDYDTIEVIISYNGGPEGTWETIPGDATSHVALDVPWGLHILTVGGACGGWGGPWTTTDFTHEPAVYVRSDTDGDGTIDLADGVRLLEYLFVGGPELDCEAAGDVNGDGSMAILDALCLFDYVFLDGPPPPAPFPDCSEDGDSAFSCISSPGCP